MAIIWFTDEDRRRMREEREAIVERDTLFFEFLREKHPDGIGIAREVPIELIDKMGLLDIRPWPDGPDEH
jgi:hypothetical protein